MDQGQPEQLQDSSFGAETSQSAILEHLYGKLQESRPEFERVYNHCHHVLTHFLELAAQRQNQDAAPIRELSIRIYDLISKAPNFSYHLVNFPTHGYYLPHHLIKTTFYTLYLALDQGYSRQRAIELGYSSLLADCGMAGVPREIMEKEGILSLEEKKVIQEHCMAGFLYLTKVLRVKPEQALIALQHHENYDGTGYPSGLKKGEIDEMTCLYSIADTFSALTSDRTYRKGYLPYDAMKLMISGLMNRFELNLLKLFLNKLSMYPVGSYVLLSNGARARVIEANEGKMLRPSVHILDILENDSRNFINLSQETDTTIVKAIPYD